MHHLNIVVKVRVLLQTLAVDLGLTENQNLRVLLSIGFHYKMINLKLTDITQNPDSVESISVDGDVADPLSGLVLEVLGQINDDIVLAHVLSADLLDPVREGG
jgi:hypothetical protein